MGLALLMVAFKAMGRRKPDEGYHEAARFRARIFGINSALGVVTDIPMEFRLGPDSARFSTCAGGVIGITLAMEGMFALFAESAVPGLFLLGEKRLAPKEHTIAAIMVWRGSWLPGPFIIVTIALMQNAIG